MPHGVYLRRETPELQYLRARLRFVEKRNRELEHQLSDRSTSLEIFKSMLCELCESNSAATAQSAKLESLLFESCRREGLLKADLSRTNREVKCIEETVASLASKLQSNECPTTYISGSGPDIGAEHSALRDTLEVLAKVDSASQQQAAKNLAQKIRAQFIQDIYNPIAANRERTKVSSRQFACNQ